MKASWVRGALLLAALAIVPACGDSTAFFVGPTGPTGPTGPPGPGSEPATWSDPINISQNVVASDENSYGQQAVFTPDGRLHVVYFTYDTGTGRDQLFYTSAADPYTAWDIPVLVTTDPNSTPYGFDLTAATNNSVHIAFVRDDTFNGYSDVVYTRNTAALRLAFTETLVFEETSAQDNITSARILMRGTIAHVVWTGYDGSNYYYNYSNQSAAWPTTTPVVLEDPFRYVDFGHYTFTSDSSGAFHLAYYVVNESRFVYYRPLPLAAATLGSTQIVNDINDETLSFDLGAPIVQFDGSNNIYVFWRRWQSSDGGPARAIICNIKGGGLFLPARATVVTVDPFVADGIVSGDFLPVFDVQVASDGRIHSAWKDPSSYGTSDHSPLFYRTKDPGVNASVGWQDAQVAAWLQQPGSTTSWNGGVNRSVLLRPAPDGTVHLFYSDTTYDNANGYNVADLHHAALLPGSSTWRSTGSPNRPTVEQSYPSPNFVSWSYFLEAGVEADGTPFALFVVDPYNVDFGSDSPGDVRYTHFGEGNWATGTDVNGPEHADVYGTSFTSGQAFELNQIQSSFWVGQDPQSRLHLIWHQEIDPFNFIDTFDLMHSNSPVPTLPAWNPKGFRRWNAGGNGGG